MSSSFVAQGCATLSSSFATQSKKFESIITMNTRTVDQIKHYQQILSKALAILPNKEDLVLFEQSIHAISMINQYQIFEIG